MVPVKGGHRAKSRLGADGAGGLALAMALDCLDAVLGCSPALVGAVVVVTSDPAVRDDALLAAEAVAGAGAGGARRLHVLEDPGGGLDAAVRAGLSAAGDAAPRAVLLADLPALRPGDLGAALDAARAHAATGHAATGQRSAVVPDAAGTGTTLLMMGPGTTLRTAFGEGSARAHQDRGAVRLELALPRLRRDVDTPADLAEAEALGVGARTAAVLAARRG